MALTIAITYGNQRRQFNAACDTDEEVLLDYQRHQRRLLPAARDDLRADLRARGFLVKFDEVFSGGRHRRRPPGPRDARRRAEAAVHLARAGHAAGGREACGGAGFLAENRFTGLRADLDVYATFEGDNNVLLQLVAKRLLTDYAQQFAIADAGAMARYVVQQTADRAYHRTGLRRVAQTIADFGSTRPLGLELRDAHPARAAGRPRRDHGRGDRRALRPARKLPKAGRGAVQRQPERAHRGGTRPRRAAAVGGVHGGLAQHDRPRHPQVLTWLRDLFGLA